MSPCGVSLSNPWSPGVEPRCHWSSEVKQGPDSGCCYHAALSRSLPRNTGPEARVGTRLKQARYRLCSQSSATWKDSFRKPLAPAWGQWTCKAPTLCPPVLATNSAQICFHPDPRLSFMPRLSPYSSLTSNPWLNPDLWLSLLPSPSLFPRPFCGSRLLWKLFRPGAGRGGDGQAISELRCHFYSHFGCS